MRRMRWACVVGFSFLFACGPNGGPPFSSSRKSLGAGPWPTDSFRNYSSAYSLGTPQSASFDDAQNLWLLDGDKIGVLKAGADRPVWSTRVGQAARGFQSSVICGADEGRAYVGYITNDLSQPENATASEKSEGDADLVKLQSDGSVSLEQHLSFVNSNDPRFDETRSVLSCAKVMRGENAGEYFFGTNHAVTRVRGTEYSDHRHAVFREPDTAQGSLRIGYNYAVSVTQEGDVFLGNEWKIGLIAPSAALGDFTDVSRSPWKLDTFVDALGPQSEEDAWRATAQTTDGRYYVGAKDKGLWEVTISPRRYARVEGLPTGRISSLAAADDGSLFIGTSDSGLWRLDASKRLSKVSEVPGTRVAQLVYEPIVQPAMLLVVSDRGVSVLRGY